MYVETYGEVPDVLDHKDQDKLNNRISNLRPATHSSNNANQTKRSHNKSGYCGVSFYKSRGLWVAQISQDKVVYNLGLYTDKEEAARVYDEAAIKRFGEYAHTNFPIENYTDYIQSLRQEHSKVA